MNQDNSTEPEIDAAAVKRYFDNEKGGSAATVSMMTHGHNLPADAAKYRLNKETETIRDWLNTVADAGRVLDLGCGAGAWTEIFAKRNHTVIGVEQSSLMLRAAKERTVRLSNVEILEGDARYYVPDGLFDMIFLGGLCMYLNGSEVIALLQLLKNHLNPGGAIILRESTVHHGELQAQGEYQAVYRSVKRYHELFDDAGFSSVEVQQNFAYTNLVTAEELVSLRRKWLPFLPHDSDILGALTWWALRGTAPVSLMALPRMLSQLGIPWPRLQNHFFRLHSEK